MLQTEYVLHIKQTVWMTAQPHGGAYGSGGEGHAAGRFVGDFYSLAFGGKQRGVVTHHVAAAYGGEAYSLRVAGAGVAFAAVNGALFQIAAERVGNHFAHAQGSAAGGVDFMAVVCFDDFDVVAFVEYTGDGVENMEGEIDADAVIGGKHDADFFSGLLDGGFAGVVGVNRVSRENGVKLAAVGATVVVTQLTELLDQGVAR